MGSLGNGRGTRFGSRPALAGSGSFLLFPLDRFLHFYFRLKPVTQVVSVGAAAGEPKVIGLLFNSLPQNRVILGKFGRLVIACI